MANIELLVREYVGLVAGRPRLSDGEAEAADRLVSAICRHDHRVAPTVEAVRAGGTLPTPTYTIDDVVLVSLATLGYRKADFKTTGALLDVA